MKRVRKTHPAAPLYFDRSLGKTGPTPEIMAQISLPAGSQLSMTTTGNVRSLQGANPLTVSYVAVPDTYTISIAAHTLVAGLMSISYNSGSITGLNSFSDTYYVYADDPQYLGGVVTYLAVASGSAAAILTAVEGRYFVGSAKIGASGGGGTPVTSSGGGGKSLAL